MSQLSNYAEKKLLDHLLGKAAYTMPTTVYLALFTADPGEAGGLTAEVTAGGYARLAITSLMTATDAATGTSTSTGAITIGPATAGWGTITHVAIMDAATAGNTLLYGPLASAKTIASGDSFQMAAGQLSAVLA